MKKFKQIWIFSDGISGHEIQSKALAHQLGQHVSVFHCRIPYPWLAFAPRVLPGLGQSVRWSKIKPDPLKLKSSIPNIIITCGRRMAAIGKLYTKKLQCKHIQILNPGDSSKNYDLMILPKHDNYSGENVITTLGSLHGLTSKHFKQVECLQHKGIRSIGLLIGNPSSEFFEKDLKPLAEKLTQHYPGYQIMVCGSRRTPEKYHATLIENFKHSTLCWLSDFDGVNPYLSLLACGDVIVVTADSINMVSEACSTSKPVIAIAEQYLSEKHQRFLFSLKDRLSTLGNHQDKHKPLQVLNGVVKQVINRL